MTYEIYRYIFIGAAIAGGIMLAVTVLRFFTLKVPRLVSDLSGATARKAIRDIRAKNERSGDKTYMASAVNLQRGKLTDRITPSGRIIPATPDAFGTGIITTKISTQELAQQELPLTEETAVLFEQETASPVSPEPAGETEVLSYEAETTLLAPAFAIEYEITYIHTDERIAME